MTTNRQPSKPRTPPATQPGPRAVSFAPAPKLTKAQEAQRLALAAPDLLEALEGLALCVEVDQWKPGMDRAGWLQQARAAIDLAKNGKRSEPR